MTRTLALAALLLATPAVAQNWLGFAREGTERAFAKPEEAEPARPDPGMTPGVADPAVTLDMVRNDLASKRRHVSKSTKACAWESYSIPKEDRGRYTLDHLIPIELGGAPNDCRNLWPEEQSEAHRKDVLEDYLAAQVRHGTPPLPLEQAQREIAEDWVAAERRYMGGR